MPKELVLCFLIVFFCFQLIFLLPAGSSGHCFLLRGKSESGPQSTCKHCLPPWSKARGNRVARRYFLILCGLTGAWAQTEVRFKPLVLESMLLGGKVNLTAQLWVCLRPQMPGHSNNKTITTSKTPQLMWNFYASGSILKGFCANYLVRTQCSFFQYILFQWHYIFSSTAYNIFKVVIFWKPGFSIFLNLSLFLPPLPSSSSWKRTWKSLQDGYLLYFS